MEAMENGKLKVGSENPKAENINAQTSDINYAESSLQNENDRTYSQGEYAHLKTPAQGGANVIPTHPKTISQSENYNTQMQSTTEKRRGEEYVHPERLALRREGEARRRAIEEEFRKINSIDPTVRSFDDLMLMENADEFASKVRKGYSLTDAFILTNRKKLSDRLKNSAVKAALSKLGAKNHLAGAGSGGGEGAVDVPAETYSLYKSLYPNITDREIKRHYKMHNK